jgi:Bacterial Ig-like domain (group 3)
MASPLTQVVNAVASTTSLVAAPEPSVLGQSVTFTATVTGTGGTPTGTVSFSLDGGPPVSVPLSSGQAAFVTSAMSPGTHSMTAAYGGDASNAPSSASTTHVVNVSGTDIALTFAPNPAVALQVVTLTATVTAAPPGAGTPTGVVHFRDAGNTFASATLSNGVATLAWGFDAGAHSVSALYVGDTNFQGSVNADQSLTVNKADSTTILSTSANPAPVGVSVTFTATVSVNPPGNGTPTGTVTFLNGANTGTGTIDANGHAVFSTSALAVGTYSITASYGADKDRNPSISAAVSQKITMDGATVALTSSANPAALGANVTFTATVSSPSDAGTPTGSIAYADGTTTLGNVALTGGVATFSTSSLAGGHHTITATYSGDVTYTGGAIGSLVETITAAPTTTALAAMPNPAMLGSAITLQATVTSTVSGTPTGSVAFVDGTSSLGTVPLSGNTASLMTSSLPVGMHSIHAAYSGDTNFASSVSPDVTEAVDGPADGGVPDGGSRDAEADGPTDAGVDGGTGGDAEAEGGGPEAGGSDSSVEPGDAGMDGSLMGDAPTFEGGVTPPDAGTATNESGSCGCRVAGSDETGSGLLALSGLAAIAGAFASRRSQRSDRTRGASR